MLLKHFKHQDWWPVDATYHQKYGSDSRFEIIIGAILTQNTAWTNVEKALDNLRQHQALTINTLLHMDEDTLKTLIKPSGFFNQKAYRLHLFTTYIHENYQDDLTAFFTRGTKEIRNELLALHGIGPETADSILLYAGNHPVFVVDAYTKRICIRLPLHIKNNTYDAIQTYFTENLQKNQPAPIYKELHALIVELAKNYCRKKPACDCCPLTLRCQKCFEFPAEHLCRDIR
jgi:endonuclease III related protein